MYPFYVLDLSEETTDAEVEARYHALLRQYPPDRAPECFRILRAAYEALKTPEARRRARLFHFDVGGRALTAELPAWLAASTPPRFSTEALARFLAAARG